MSNISSLLSAEDKDAFWLQQMLQTAIALEFATIPPYLCAYWSIDEAPPGYIKQRLQHILGEEMSHLGLACNLLSAFQVPLSDLVLPALNTPDVVPLYPGPLPGGVRPGLQLSLSKLTKDQVSNQFMQIEFPSPEAVQVYGSSTFPTIGAFYQAIYDFIKHEDLSVSLAYQVKSGRNYVFRITCKEDALTAIQLIASEGEGARGSPFVQNAGGSRELAHYYQFAEFFWQRRIVECGTGGWGFGGNKDDVIDWPAKIYDMAPVPPGGYVTKDAFDFDIEYTRILTLLTRAWHTPDPNEADAIVEDAISLMMLPVTKPGSLQELAVRLMTTRRPFGEGTLGPCFRLAF